MGLKGFIEDSVFHVKQVELNSVSDDLCIAVGDKILAINSKPLTKKLLESLMVKESLVLKVKRRFETIDLELVFKIDITILNLVFSIGKRSDAVKYYLING
ncbi:MAG: hypothetical protein CM15mP23_10630 [Cryomorphaceae bacterium]|nr:MAG: hypothetical protein CM15mP23_10630 [Cryomorphaceae bacterium]